ncbi:MAG: PilZ domain-containing protein [Desulfobacterota bacterium]|nr:PilZ domain-containing protein [Thermodesulfobacteriota bacterium]
MLQGNEQGYTTYEPLSLFVLSSDRRANPYIRSRQRRKFDRRQAMRVGIQAMTFVSENGKIKAGRLLDISDTGGHIEVDGHEPIEQQRFLIGIPLLSGKQIHCERVWTRNDNGNACRYGVRFINLSPRDKAELRKRYLLNPDVIAGYAHTLSARTQSHKQQEEIKSFFLIDVRRALEELIEIDHMIAQQLPHELILQRCTKTLDELVVAGERLADIVDNEVLMKDVKQRVRLVLGYFLYQSTVFKRGFEKPRGYPGDYQMLEIVYNNREVSQGIGAYIDRYGLEVPYAVAIRLRKDTMRDILKEYLNTSTEPALKILNLASGGCREIRELCEQQLSYAGVVDLYCIDQDDAALDFSRQALSALDNGCLHVHLVKGNIVRLEDIDLGTDNSFDLIYSIGIADYLQDRMLMKIFRDSYNKLKVGGRLIVAYKDKERHKPVALNWYGDWYFIPRNEEELIRLAQEAIGKDNISVSVIREPSGVIFFADIKKIK